MCHFFSRTVRQIPSSMSKKICALILSLLWSVPAFATHPLITDDTATQGKGKFQLELNAESSRDEEHEGSITKKETGGISSAALSYGVVDNVDIIVGFPWQWSSIKEDGKMISDNNGIADTSVGVKWRFFECKEDEWSLAIKPGVTIPTGDAAKGFGNGKISGSMMLIATKGWQHGAVHCNVGYTHNSYGQDHDNETLKQDIWHASLATEIKMTEKLRSVADIGIDTNNEKTPNTNPVYILGGLIYSVSENVDLDVGVKTGTNHAERDKTVLAGLTVRF